MKYVRPTHELRSLANSRDRLVDSVDVPRFGRHTKHATSPLPGCDSTSIDAALVNLEHQLIENMTEDSIATTAANVFHNRYTGRGEAIIGIENQNPITLCLLYDCVPSQAEVIAPLDRNRARAIPMRNLLRLIGRSRVDTDNDFVNDAMRTA